ncbi:MAG: DUF4838 domain-containing protein, partial [Armatimonadetes bacterium]|nr:DUF4838 domain-containing protein [Armatimonadota bacterium]
TIEWDGSGPVPGDAMIIVATAAADGVPAGVKEKLAGANDEGCAVWPEGGRVWLVGKGPMGLPHAVYQYLYLLGCRWYFPGPLGEQVPRISPERLVAVKPYVHVPQMVYRSMWLAYGGRPAWQRDEYGEFARRNHQGGVAMQMGHNLYSIVPPATYGQTHPEYFPLIGGARLVPQPKQAENWQPCTSNPEVIRLAVEAARRYFDERQDAWSFSLSPNDGYGWCQCDNCRAQDPPEYRDQPNRGKGRRMLVFANAVARELAKTHPGKRVCFYAYAGSVEPPTDIVAEPNVDVALAHYGWCACYVHPITDPDCRQNQQFQKLVEGWKKVAGSLIAREYFNGLMPPVHMLAAVATGYTLLDNIRYYARNQFIGINSEAIANFGAEMLNFYVASRLMWEPEQDTAALLDDFYRGCFGPAADAVRRFYEAIVSHAKQAARDSAPYLSAALMEQLDAMLRDAEAAADASPYRERVRMVRDAYEYTRLVRELVSTGSPEVAERLDGLVARCESEHSWAIDPVVHRHRVSRVPETPAPPFKVTSARRFSDERIPEEAYKVRWVVRGTHFFVWLADRERSFSLTNVRLGNYLDPVVAAVCSPAGQVLAEASAKVRQSAKIELPPQVQGAVVIALNSGGNAAAVEAPGPLVLYGRSIHFLGATGWLYVLPVENADRVNIAVHTDAPGETAKIELRRPDNTLAAAAETVETGGCEVSGEIKPEERGKPWSFRIVPASQGVCEDVMLSLGPGLHPVIATHPARLVIVQCQ